MTDDVDVTRDRCSDRIAITDVAFDQLEALELREIGSVAPLVIGRIEVAVERVDADDVVAARHESFARV